MDIELLDQSKDMLFIFGEGEGILGQVLEAKHCGLLVLGQLLALLPLESLRLKSVHRILRLHLTMLKKHLIKILTERFFPL